MIPSRPTRLLPGARAAAVLLEVIFSLALFCSMAAVIVGSLNASLGALRQVRLEARAADLAVTLLSEIQMGLVALQDQGPQDYAEQDLADWNWQIVTSAVDNSSLDVSLTRAEIVIFNKTQGYTYRLVQLFRIEQTEGLMAWRTGPAASGGGP